MAIDKTTIKLLLDYLDGEIKTIKKSGITEEVLIASENETLTDATKHRVQTAVEAVINIAEHIVAGLKLGKPEYAKELFPILAKEGIISNELAEKLSQAVGLRNVLVHLYLEVNLEILAEAATTDLNDLREFAKQINDFLNKQPSNN